MVGHKYLVKDRGVLMEGYTSAGMVFAAQEPYPPVQAERPNHRYAEAMLVAYNRKCKNALPWNKLYAKAAAEDAHSSMEEEPESQEFAP